MVRSQIADRPQIYPPGASDPEIIGFGDGTSTIFALSFENFIAGTLTIYTAGTASAGQPATFTAVSATLYTVGSAPVSGLTTATNQVITFTTAPAVGTMIGARYQATAFSDADLANYLANAQIVGWPDDRTTLKAVTFDMIDVILMDQRRLEMLAQGDYKRDAAAYANGLMKLKESLRKDLAGGPLPGSTIAAIGFGVAPASRYSPIR
jgi:hypothetical protein